MYADEKDLRSLWAITVAAFLVLSLKLGALVQYWQQTHHILLDVNPQAASADWFHLQDDINNLRIKWEETQTQIEGRLLKAGQIIVAGDAALPPQLPCPKTEMSVEKPQCPAVNTIVNLAEETVKDKTKNTVETVKPSVSVVIQSESSSSTLIESPSQPNLPLADTDTPIKLTTGDKVLLIGDSMMQGLGPHIVSNLGRNYGIQVVDLSRHSTGLAYPNYFDWPATVEQKFTENAFALLVVFLGANDTWDIVINGRYTSFGHEKWIEVYAARVEKIIQTAKAHNTRVLWLGAPPMGRDKMSERIPTLNKIFTQVAAKYPGVVRFVDTGPTLTQDGKTFSKFIELPDRGNIRVRTDDGVHFTPTGQRLLAQDLISELELIKSDVERSVTGQSSAASPQSTKVESPSSMSSQNLSVASSTVSTDASLSSASSSTVSSESASSSLLSSASSKKKISSEAQSSSISSLTQESSFHEMSTHEGKHDE